MEQVIEIKHQHLLGPTLTCLQIISESFQSKKQIYKLQKIVFHWEKMYMHNTLVFSSVLSCMHFFCARE